MSVVKGSGFKEYNARFWVNERGASGCRYQCKQCGRTKLGLSNNGEDTSHHNTTCPLFPELHERALARERDVVARSVEHRLATIAQEIEYIRQLGHRLPGKQPLVVRAVGGTLEVYEDGGTEPLASRADITMETR